MTFIWHECAASLFIGCLFRAECAIDAFMPIERMWYTHSLIHFASLVNYWRVVNIVDSTKRKQMYWDRYRFKLAIKLSDRGERLIAINIHPRKQNGSSTSFDFGVAAEVMLIFAHEFGLILHKAGPCDTYQILQVLHLMAFHFSFHSRLSLGIFPIFLPIIASFRIWFHKYLNRLLWSWCAEKQLTTINYRLFDDYHMKRHNYFRLWMMACIVCFFAHFLLFDFSLDSTEFERSNSLMFHDIMCWQYRFSMQQ